MKKTCLLQKFVTAGVIQAGKMTAFDVIRNFWVNFLLEPMSNFIHLSLKLQSRLYDISGGFIYEEILKQPGLISGQCLCRTLATDPL